MDEKLKATIQKIQLLAAQNPDFEREMRSIFGGKASIILNDYKRLDDIYEYCIQKIIKKQAEDFYKNFQLNSLIPLLIEDYIRMEDFRRKDNFGDFCLAVYQQIEAITNTICNNPKMQTITSAMWQCPAYIKPSKDLNGASPIISERKGNFTIAGLIFGKNKSEERSKTSLSNMSAIEKIKIVIYFLHFKAMMFSPQYNDFNEITNSIVDIYQCRNLNHRGNIPSDSQKEIIDRVLAEKSFYCYKFLSGLIKYIDFVNSGFENMETTIFNYANNLHNDR